MWIVKRLFFFIVKRDPYPPPPPSHPLQRDMESELLQRFQSKGGLGSGGPLQKTFTFVKLQDCILQKWLSFHKTNDFIVYDTPT
jgi:hypothetical protein